MRRLDASDPGFAAEFGALVDDRRESASDVSADVAGIIARVKSEGDAALADYTARFDRFDLDASRWSISKEECAAAYDGLAPDLRELGIVSGAARPASAAGPRLPQWATWGWLSALDTAAVPTRSQPPVSSADGVPSDESTEDRGESSESDSGGDE